MPDIELLAAGRPEVDLERPGSVAAAIRSAAPDVVINAAAYTAVDQAETEPGRAFRINAEAAGEAAIAAAEVAAATIQISTDYVFDGSTSAGYREEDPACPLNVYGRSKLAGETLVKKANPRHAIVRTSWIYSPFGNNFVKTMLRLAADRDEIAVVSDQVGNPTSALDLADALLLMLPAMSSGNGNIGKIYHLAAPNACSWADLAVHIFRSSGALGGPTARVTPVPSAQYPTLARRPSNSMLDSSRFFSDFGARLPQWQASVETVLKRLIR